MSPGDLAFIPTCIRCGAVGQPVPVDDGNWNAAALWSWLALKAHRCADLIPMPTANPVYPYDHAED